MKKIYIAGPMTGLPDLNFPAFHAAAAQLRADGHEVVNPADVNPDQGTPWIDCMKQDLRELVGCSAIYLLDGWEKSRGASLERHVAHALEFEIMQAPRVVLSPFVTVPATTFPDGHIEPSFEVGRYLTSQSLAGAAVIDAALAPWVRINYAEARAAASAAGFALITERQALAIAINIASVAANWTGGAVGEGSLRQGLRSGEFDSAQPGDVVPADADEQRWFVLSNGERICDGAGSAYTWVFDNVQGDDAGLVSKPFAARSPSISSAPFPSLERGVGWYPRAGADWAGFALVRGGDWGGEDVAGVFYLDLGWPDYRVDNVGFRCTTPRSGL